MSKSVYQINEEARIKYKTSGNKYTDFPVGTKVKIICKAQDSYFFKGDETGIVTKNTGRYLGIIVKFDKPRHFEHGYIQKDFNFEPNDLIITEEEQKMRTGILVVIEATVVEDIGTVEELLLARNQLAIIQNGYNGLTLPVPEWVDNKLSEVENEIQMRVKNDLQRRLRSAKARRSALRTADEKRKALDDEIQELEKQLS